ncbi:hypothetical protein [Ekhidna sp.]|uniref:hypothetical protein n=1 Tax=Ekhidna sp. TaxID=2608089 RepID=UPI0035198030
MKKTTTLIGIALLILLYSCNEGSEEIRHQDGIFDEISQILIDSPSIIVLSSNVDPSLSKISFEFQNDESKFEILELIQKTMIEHGRPNGFIDLLSNDLIKRGRTQSCTEKWELLIYPSGNEMICVTQNCNGNIDAMCYYTLIQ